MKGIVTVSIKINNNKIYVALDLKFYFGMNISVLRELLCDVIGHTRIVFYSVKSSQFTAQIVCLLLQPLF